MGLFSFFDDWSKEIEKDNQRRKARELEEEMDYYGLDDEEKRLVREEGYEPEDFFYPGDDDLDEEDYYSEDDDY